MKEPLTAGYFNLQPGFPVVFLSVEENNNIFLNNYIFFKRQAEIF